MLKRSRWTWNLLGYACFVFACFALVTQQDVYAQGEWIYRMDANNNGIIEPEEISERGRPYLEEFVRPFGLSLDKPHSVKMLEEAARRSQRLREQGSSSESASSMRGVLGFGPPEGSQLIPGFGLARIPYPYTADDMSRVERLLSRYDRNGDGLLDREEVREGTWTSGDPYEFDLNRDGRLSQLELAQRYARRRIVEDQEFNRQASAGSSQGSANSGRDGASSWNRWDGRFSRAGQSRDGDRGSFSLAESLIQRYDYDRNLVLDATEMGAVGILVTAVDLDRDGKVDAEELSKYLFSQMESQAADASEELIPTWFFERDLNGDRQVEMREFAEQWDEATSLEFAAYDLNEDGLITRNEILSSKSVVGGEFRNSQAQFLLPRSTVVSEIEVDEDYLIGDLNIQLSITHTYTSYLDAYLISPDGQRVELFSSVGGSDDHFDRTVIDDDVGENITRARPPFRGTFQPSALVRRQPGLNQFRGKNLKGVWQLMIRGSRSDRSGILHGWALLVKPDREAVNQLGEVEQRLQSNAKPEDERGDRMEEAQRERRFGDR